MFSFEYWKKMLVDTKRRLQDNSLDSLLWLVNIGPSFAGFSIHGDIIKVPFWIFHLYLLFYVYGLGSFVYQVKYAQNAGDFIKSNVNVSILILTANNSYWFLMKRPLLRIALKQITRNDELARSENFRILHERLISNIKKMLFIFYGSNLIDLFLIYLPRRMDIFSEFSMTPCVGLQPLHSIIRRELCHAILGMQELTIAMVVLNYQALLLFLIAHTSMMFHILSEELMTLSNFEYSHSQSSSVDRSRLKSKLDCIIERHALTLDIIETLKSLYSMPIGINFGCNAVCICLFLYLPLCDIVKFIPVLVYCFLVFFLYCFLCQKLIDASEVFERAVYSCGWERFDLKERKIIYIMLLQAQKPVELKAADIISVNIYTFATTLQAIFKFVTVIKF